MPVAGGTAASAGHSGQNVVDKAQMSEASLRSSLSIDGDRLVAIKQNLAGAVSRTQHDKNAEVISIRDFGAKGDGVTDDTAAIQAALDTGRDIYIPAGLYVCTEELEVKTHGQRIHGAGRGYGYSSNVVKLEHGDIVPKWSSALFNWQHVSTLIFKGTGKKRVRTRVNYRASALDPQDDPLSVCLNIQAEGTSHENYCVFLDIQPPAGGPEAELKDKISNLGANWDIGIFIGCRPNTSLKEMAVIGYHRKANVWYDVTQAINLPRFNSFRGGVYPQGPVENGADGCSSDGLFTSGGLWGVNVQGAKPKEGQISYSTPYYDENLRATVEDYRGSWGFSDFLMINGQIFGANHHTRRRLVDMKSSPDPTRDWDVGGAFNIDGITLNDNHVLHGHRYIGCRFQSWAPFCVRIDRSARDAFFGCMIENPNSVVRSKEGHLLKLSPETSFYGLCATERHRFLTISESQAPYSSTYTKLLYGDAQFANASQANPVTRTPYNRLEVLSKDDQTTAVLRLGTIDNPNKATISRAVLGSMVFTSDASLLFQDPSGVKKFQVTEAGSMITLGSLFPSKDNNAECGNPSNRWSQIHAATGTINTSDQRLKTTPEPISDSVLRAWGKVEFLQYQFTDAVEKKGADSARIHFGVIAQRVKEAFESEGLDPFAYGVLCFDHWEDEYEPIIGNREVIREGERFREEFDTGERRLVRAAGNRFGIRYEEALVLECAYLRWRIGQIK